MAYEILQDEPQGFEILPPVKERKALSAGERFLYGLRAPLDAGTQMAVDLNRRLADAGVPVRRLPGDPTKGERERKAAYDAGKPEGFDLPYMAGNIVSPASLALMAVPGGTVPRAMMLGAAGGALQPAEEGDTFWSEKARQAGAGAVTGGVLQAGSGAVSRFLSPNASRNPDVAMLAREGVNPTIGQTLGGRINAMEEKLTSIPFMGDMIAKARGRARNDFNRATMNRVLRPIGQRADEIGHEGVGQAGRAVSRVYDAADNIGMSRLDRPGVQEIRRVMDRAQTQLPQREQDELRRIWQRTAGQEMTPTGRIRDFKALDSTLGGEAAAFRGTTDAYQRRLGDQLGDLQNAVRDSVLRRNPQQQLLRGQADEAYSLLTRLETAAQKNPESGVFTPGQLLSAIREGDKSLRNRVTARGEAPLQDFGAAAQRVLGNKQPNSGTADRFIPWSILTGGLGAGAAFNPAASATAAAAIGAGGLAYTAPVQRALVMMASRRPEVAHAGAQMLREITARSAPAAGMAGANLLDDDYTGY